MREQLEHIEVPGAAAAEARAARIVAAAYDVREPITRRPNRLVRPALAALAVAAVATLVSPPGRAVVDRVRETVGVEAAQPALFRLPAPGRLLVRSDAGIWVVNTDGGRRLLGAYREAAWSPFGAYVAATRTNELAVLTPEGTVRWSLARPGVRRPRWTGTRTDTRIAYVDNSGLRIVAGDGTGDRLLAPAATGPAAWRPGGARELAYVSASEVRVQDTDDGRVVWRTSRGRAEEIVSLSWSTDGSRLLVLGRRSLLVYDSRGRLVASHEAPSGTTDSAAAFVPGTREIAVLRTHGGDSDVIVLGRERRLFRSSGALQDLTLAPDGEWLLVTWPLAEQWLFVGTDGRRRVRAVADPSPQFGSTSFPHVQGWCCTK